jgi:CxxC motif-containing protein
MKEKKIVCIQCPMGCRLLIKIDENGKFVDASGNRCPNGYNYAKQEVENPHRVLPTNVFVEGGTLPLVSVKTDKPVPKSMIGEIMKIIKVTHTKAPVKIGDVIISNILNTGSNIVATRNVEKK